MLLETETETVPTEVASSTGSTLRAWWFLFRFSLRRQARSHLLVWVSIALLALMTLLVAISTFSGRWTMSYWRIPRGKTAITVQQHIDRLTIATKAMPFPSEANAIQAGVLGSIQTYVAGSGFTVFSRFIVFAIFATFLLPLWSICFSTEALGRELESGTLIWTVSRPLPRWSIYLCKYLASLPWNMALILGGFTILCIAGGYWGRKCLEVYWVAVVMGTLAFTSLFQLFGVLFRRPAIIAILYAFFLETLMGNLPGYLKRGSISFYTRCLMFDAGKSYGVSPDRPGFYIPVDGMTAWLTLTILTITLLLVGMMVFSRSEYLDQS